MASRMQAKGKVVDLANQLIAGTNRHLANATQVLLVGGSFTPAQITTQLQEFAKLRGEVEAARALMKAKLAVEASEMPALRVFLDAFVSFVRAAFGTQPDVLADFGLHPKARKELNVETKTAAGAKRAATRAARHTAGPKQKKSIKGAVTGILVTPLTGTKPVAPRSRSSPGSTTGTTASTAPHTRA